MRQSIVRIACDACAMTPPTTSPTTSPATAASISWDQALAWRLGRQLLDQPGERSATEVVQTLGAVLATHPSSAELAVRSRQDRSRPGELAQALTEGTVIKTFAYRGAMHHLSAQDGGIYLALRAAGRQWELRSWVEFYRLTAQQWPRFRETVRDALRDGPLTVPELGARVTGRSSYKHLQPVFADDPWTLLKALCWQGDICFGPSVQGKPTFQRLDANSHWAGIPTLDEAGPRAILAYLHSYGPATGEHIQHWFGEGLSAGRKRLERWRTELGDRLVPLDVDGTTTFAAAQDVESILAAEPSDAVHFLPGHDQWVMGPGTKDPHITPPPYRAAMTRQAGIVLRGGVVSGTWAVRGSELHVSSPVQPAELQEQAERLVGLLGQDLEIHYTKA